MMTGLLAIASVSPHAKVMVFGDEASVRAWLIGSGIAVGIAGGVILGRRQLRLDALAAENQSLRRGSESSATALLRLIRGELARLQQAARLFSNERVSLFRWEGDGFILVGRHSPYTKYERAGREQYPPEEGCLGEAWRDGRAVEKGLPPAGQSQPWNARWRAAQRSRHRVPDETSQLLTMPSRSYVAYRLQGPERAVGVLVFESINTLAEAEQVSRDASTLVGLAPERLDEVVREAAVRLADLLVESRFLDGTAIAGTMPTMSQ